MVLVSRRERLVVEGWRRSVGWQSAKGCGFWEETGGARTAARGHRARQEQATRCAKAREVAAVNVEGGQQANRQNVLKRCTAKGGEEEAASDDLPLLSDAAGGGVRWSEGSGSGW